jgi:putative peptidoglycan lipid II flippase
MNISALGMLVICLILFIFTKPLTELIVPGFTPAQLDSTVSLTRIMLLSPIIFTISNVLSSVLISMKKFLIVNIAPLLYNLGIILGIVFLYPRYGLAGLGIGVIFGAVLHALIQVPEALRHGYRWKPTMSYSDPGVQKIGALFLPRIFGLDNSYVNLIIVSIIGSTLAVGSITAFNYANNIQAVALGIFALSSAVAVFPVLSEYFAKRDTNGFINTLQHTVIRTLYFVVPITILLLLLRAQVVRLLLGYGRCDWYCTTLTFDTLGVLALGLVAQSLIPLFARAFYSRQNTRTPVLISLIGITINILLSYLLAAGLGVVGIALGFVIASTVQCILLFASLHNVFAKQDEPVPKMLALFDATLVTQSLKILIASMLLGVVTYSALYVVAPLVNTHTVVGIFLQATISTLLGGVAYILLTNRLQVYESKYIAASVVKIWRFITRKSPN